MDVQVAVEINCGAIGVDACDATVAGAAVSGWAALDDNKPAARTVAGDFYVAVHGQVCAGSCEYGRHAAGTVTSGPGTVVNASSNAIGQYLKRAAGKRDRIGSTGAVKIGGAAGAVSAKTRISATGRAYGANQEAL